MIIASESSLDTILHVTFSSGIRISWHRLPIEGIGLEWGRERVSPSCNCRNKNPASSRAARDIGGVFISPCNIINGLLDGIDTVLCKKLIHAIQIGNEIFSAKENQLAHTKNEKALARFDALASETAVKSTN